MRLVFTRNAWEEYSTWFEQDKNMLKKINSLIKEIQRTPFEGKGKPEPLKYDLTGLWSRRIERGHRLVYQIGNNEIIIVSCKYHYDRQL